MTAENAGIDVLSYEHSGRYPDEYGVDIKGATSSVQLKYRGTETDRREMAALGKVQTLRRTFRFVTMVGFASNVMASWEILNPLFTFVLTDGGTADLFWGFIVVACGMVFVYASIAELAAMSPTSGGQYHWASEYSPPRIQKLLSYSVGWLCAIGWQVYLAGVCFMVAGIIQGLIELNVEGYVWKDYHGTLLTIAVISTAAVFNLFLAKQLPLLEGILLILHIVGFFAIIIPLWVMAPRANPHDALLHFTNFGGWSSTGLSAMIGLTSPLSVLIGYDCSVHMSEEIEDASLTLPKAMMWSVATNATLAFLMAVTLIFTLGDIDNILASPTRQPFIQVFYNATGSYGGTNTMCAIIVIMLWSCCISEVATASRQVWAFARDEGLPYSTWLAVVDPGFNIPIRAVSVCMVITALLACINLGSSVALNAINSLGSVGILTSYFIVISCLVWRRLYGAPLPQKRWSLGKWGLCINIVALIFLLPMWFFAFWPLATPVTAATMNWSSAMFVGVMAIAMIFYLLKGRHVYVGPVMLIKRQ
ncbi:hypothetical protein MBLNU459_g2359t1 [Dothideomycetes sp. NU459]